MSEKLKKENILGILVNTDAENVIIADIINRLSASRGKCFTIVFANAFSITESHTNPDFKKALNDAEYSLPDGGGVIFASKMNNGCVKCRIPGPDLFLKINDYLNNLEDMKYFFLGATDETLAAISEKMNKEYPNIEIVGLYSPPFGQWTEEEDNKIIEMINNSNADLVWVGLGAPKQEIWLNKNKTMLNTKIGAGIGAAFDFYIGNEARAPKVIQWLQVEWLYRFLLNPKKRFKKSLSAQFKLFLKIILSKFGFR